MPFASHLPTDVVPHAASNPSTDLALDCSPDLPFTVPPNLPISQPTKEDSPYLYEMGVRFLEMGGGRARLALALTEHHMNSWQVTHGGVTMTLLDVVMAMAGRSLTEDLKGVVTVEMKTTFLRPGGVPGGRLEARGHAYHQSTTMCFCEGELWHGDQLVAKATGTFKYLRRLQSRGSAKALLGSD